MFTHIVQAGATGLVLTTLEKKKEEAERVKKSVFLANRRRYAQIPDSKFHATFWGLAIL